MLRDSIINFPSFTENEQASETIRQSSIESIKSEEFKITLELNSRLGIFLSSLSTSIKLIEKFLFILSSIEIFKKLSKLANAVDKYTEEEAKIVNEFKEKLRKDGKRIAHHSDILEAAIEEVLSQAKSTLDVTVKIYDPLFGIKLHTYGKNGDKLISALRSNTPAQDKDKVGRIINVVELFKPYSESIIRLRTTTQHYKNIQMTPMVAEINEKGSIVILLPKTSQEQTAKEFAEIVYHNIFVFIRDLLIFTFASKFYGGIIPVVIEEKGDRIKKIGVTISEDALQK